MSTSATVGRSSTRYENRRGETIPRFTANSMKRAKARMRLRCEAEIPR